MKSLKILSFFILMFFIISIFSSLSFVSASSICPAAINDTSNTSSTSISAVHPSSTSSVSARYMAFTANTTCYLYSADFLAYKVTDSATMKATLRPVAQGSIVGTNAYPTSTILAESDTISTADWAGTEAMHRFTFDGNYQMQSGTSYCIVFEMVSKTSTGFVRTWMASTTSAMNGGTFASNVFSAETNDFGFVINADTEPFSATPTPTPTPPPQSIPDGYLSATFGISPVNSSHLDWQTYPVTFGNGFEGHDGTYQLMNGTGVFVIARPSAGWVFDHWEASTGEYLFTPTINPITFTGTNSFNITAVMVESAESDTIVITLPKTTGGCIDVTYSDGTFSQTYTSITFQDKVDVDSFAVKYGTNLTLTAIYSTGYVYYGMEIIPEVEGVYVAQTITATSRDIQALYNCTIRGIFALGGSGGSNGGSTSSDKVANVSILLIAFFFGDNTDSIGLGIPLIIIIACAYLSYRFAGAWGFFAGLNVGIILCVMVNVLGLWAIVLIAVVDILGITGKIPIEDNKFKVSG